MCLLCFSLSSSKIRISNNPDATAKGRRSTLWYICVLYSRGATAIFFFIHLSIGDWINFSQINETPHHHHHPERVKVIVERTEFSNDKDEAKSCLTSKSPPKNVKKKISYDDRSDERNKRARTLRPFSVTSISIQTSGVKGIVRNDERDDGVVT